MLYKKGDKLICNKHHWAYGRRYAKVTKDCAKGDYGVWIQLYSIKTNKAMEGGCDNVRGFDKMIVSNSEEECEQ